jgi:hypothetical protein
MLLELGIMCGLWGSPKTSEKVELLKEDDTPSTIVCLVTFAVDKLN